MAKRGRPGAETRSPVDPYAQPRKIHYGVLPTFTRELLKLGSIIGETTVTKYMVRHRLPMSTGG